MRKFIDFIVTIAVLVLLFLAFITGSGGRIQLSPFNIIYGEAGMDVLTGITTSTVSLLGVVTIFDICRAFGLESFVPSFIIKAKKRNEEETIKQIIDSYSGRFDEQWGTAAKNVLDTYYGENFSRYSELLEVYFRKDLAFVKSYHRARTDYIMQRLGIKRSEMLEGLIRLRAMPLKNTKNAIDRMKYILKNMPNIIIKQEEDPVERTYQDVQFYIDFVSSMRDNEYGKQLSRTFARYIMLDMEENKFKNITKVVIPSDSNFLLGFKVAESLDCPPVIMRDKNGRIFREEPWDGKLSPDDSVIIVHDVLVSGKQVVSAMQKLKNYGVEVVAVYCIIDRKEYSGEMEITSEDSNCKVRAMLELNDDIINNDYYRDK